MPFQNLSQKDSNTFLNGASVFDTSFFTSISSDGFQRRGTSFMEYCKSLKFARLKSLSEPAIDGS